MQPAQVPVYILAVVPDRRPGKSNCALRGSHPHRLMDSVAPGGSIAKQSRAGQDPLHKKYDLVI